MRLENLRTPLLTYMRLRSALFATQGLMGPLIDVALSGRRPRLPTDDKQMFNASMKSLDELLRRDTENILAGIYPVSVLKPEAPLKHMLRIPKMFREGLQIAKRRKEKRSHDFKETVADRLEDVPDYYHRNFHFQGDGYLSEESAELYDHQVEILFAGAANAMRRLILPPLKKHFANSDGRGLKFLELGSGTGTATRFVRMAFPKAQIVSVDLSAPYLHQAQERLREFDHHDFIEGRAEDLPFQDQHFDAVYSVFLFHELPSEIRKKVVQEAIRLLKPGGFFGAVDSLQSGDVPEFDQALLEFPQQFHEPFYRNYIQSPLEVLMTESGLSDTQTETGFFSKVTYALKKLQKRSKVESPLET